MSGLENEQTNSMPVACQVFEQNLSAYLEGESRPEVSAHALACPYCQVLLADLEQVRFASRHLPIEEPPTRVWANIRATLAEEGIIREQVPAWRRWIPQLSVRPVGALAGLAMLALILLGTPHGYETTGTSDILPETEGVVAAGLAASGGSGNWGRTLKEMEEAYMAREGSMEPTLRDTYARSLSALDTTIQECTRHCRRDPRNTLARQYLMRAYHSKIEVLASALENNYR
jgi:hypothetical protein